MRHNTHLKHPRKADSCNNNRNSKPFEDIAKNISRVLSTPLFFISGVQKSGTTWLQKALDAHPQMMCSGEGHFIDVAASAIKQMIGYYHKNLDAVSTEVYGRQPYYTPLTIEEQHFFTYSLIGLMLGRRTIGENIRCIGDKTPGNAVYINELHHLFPQAKYVHIVRDVRDVFVSTLKHQERVLPGQQDLTFNQFQTFVGTRWVMLNSAALEFGRQHPNLFHCVHYEALINDFEGSFAEVLRFLDVDATFPLIRSCKEMADFKRLSGGRENGVEDTSSFFRKGIAGDWKNHYKEKDLATLYRLCGPLWKKFGLLPEQKPAMMPHMIPEVTQ